MLHNQTQGIAFGIYFCLPTESLSSLKCYWKLFLHRLVARKYSQD